MNFKRSVLVLICYAILVNGFSQVSNRKEESTKSMDISRSRTILLDKFIENNKLATMLEVDRLMMYDNEDYIALYPIEFWLLSYWLNDYEAILSSNRLIGSEEQTIEKQTVRIPPQRDYLAPKLIEKLTAEKDSLIGRVKSAKVTGEEKAFLLMTLESLLPSAGSEQAAQDTLNSLADQFLAQYPHSEYAEFTRKYIRVKYTASKSGMGYTFFLGKFLFGGNLSSYYTHPTLIGLSLDVINNSWIYQLNLAFGFNKTRADMPVNTVVWPKGAKAIGGYINLSAGRYIIDKRHFSLAPVAGVGIFGLDPSDNTDKHPEYKGAGIKTNIAGSLGVLGDFKLNTKNSSSPYRQYGTSTTFIRVGYEFIASPLKNNFVDYSGAVHKVTIAIGASAKKAVRSY